MKDKRIKIEEISVINKKLIEDIKLAIIPNLLSYGFKDGFEVRRVIRYIHDTKPNYILIPSEVNSFNRLGAGNLNILGNKLHSLTDVSSVIMASNKSDLESFENMKARIISVNDKSFTSKSICIHSNDRAVKYVDYDKFNINLLSDTKLSDDYLKLFPNTDLVISSTCEVDSDTVGNKVYIKDNKVNGYMCSSDANNISVATINLLRQ